MINEKPVGSKIIRMRELCINLYNLKSSLDLARTNKAGSEIQIIDFDTLIIGTVNNINILEKEDIKALTDDEVKEVINSRKPPLGVR